MGHTLHGIYESGGGRMAYVWHVLGYPWAVGTDPSLIEALRILGAGHDDHDNAAKHARRRMFGSAHWTVNGAEYYPAYTCPVFPTLLWDSLGAEEWTLDQSKGILDSSGWSVELLDDDIAWDWPHKAEGDEFYGLEGVHRVANLEESSKIGWGSLRRDLMRKNVDATRPETVSILEESGGRLFDRIDALGGNDHLVLWCEHEAIAVVSATTPVVNEFRAFIADEGEGRGLYGSRIADHLYRPTIGCMPVISDVPLGIAGEYCRLWQIPLDENGEMVLGPEDSNGDFLPIIANQRNGVVSTNIRTNANKTSIDILPWTDALKMDVDKRELARTYEAHLKKFVLCRGINSGTSFDNLYRWQQCPHLVIHEQQWVFIDELELDEIVHSYIPIWLCRPGETVVFDSAKDLIEALNKELSAVINHSDSQLTGQGLTGEFAKPWMSPTTRDFPISLSWSTYTAVSDDNGYLGPMLVQNPSHKDLVFTAGHEELERFLPCFVTGPLAFMLGLGNPWMTKVVKKEKGELEDKIIYQPTDFINMPYFDKYKENRKESIFSLEYENNKMIGSSQGNTWLLIADQRALGSGEYKYDPEIDVENYRSKGVRNRHNRTQYYYQWDWVNHHPGEWKESDNDHRIPLESYRYFIPHTEDDPTLYVDYADVLTLGETVQIDKILKGTIDGIEDNGTTDELTFVDDELDVYKKEILYGQSLFYIPLMETESLDKIEEAIDPNTIKKITSINTQYISGIFRALLGETVTDAYIAPELQMSWNPFFTDDPADIIEGGNAVLEGFSSLIDWESMYDCLWPYHMHAYTFDESTEDSLYEILKAELMLHCAQMIMDWDYDLLMWRATFKNIGPLNKSDAFMAGRNLTAGENLSEVPAITHNASQIVNKFILKTRYGEVNLIGDRTASVKIQNREITIKPSISIFGVDPAVGLATENMSDMADRFRSTLRYLSKPVVSQSRGLTCAGTFKAILGRESLLTDAASRNPLTHGLGVNRQPVLITSRAHDLSKETIDITYTIGGPSGYGWAPSCKVLAGNHEVLSGSSWKLTPEDHEYTEPDDVTDLYYFDCYDTRIPFAPSPRNCSCDDYAVKAVECGTRGFTPLPFTCKLEFEGDGTPYLLLTGTTSGIDEDKNYVLYFAKYDDCQPCQRFWIFGADEYNRVGDNNENPFRWV